MITMATSLSGGRGIPSLMDYSGQGDECDRGLRWPATEVGVRVAVAQDLTPMTIENDSRPVTFAFATRSKGSGILIPGHTGAR